MHNIISGTWATKSQSYIDKTSKILNLVGYLQPYLHKDGLKDAKEDMILLIDYITDVAKGNYTDYNVNRLLIVIAALLYVIDPIDMIPDFIDNIGQRIPPVALQRIPVVSLKRYHS